MVLLNTLLESSPLTFTTTLSLAVLLALGTLVIYRLHIHPLSRIPGPWYCALTSLWTYYHAYVGDECTLITALHKRYGPVLRIAPNEVCFADNSALNPIYADKGGMLKAGCYRNFDIDGFASLFSETVRESRAPRAKSVVPLFSTQQLRDGEEVLEGVVATFVRRLRSERERVEGGEGVVNVLDLSRGLALDAVTGYLLGKSYGGLEEQSSDSEGHCKKEKKQRQQQQHMSASEFVDAFVGVGRFFYLPNWIFVGLEMLSEKCFGTKETAESMDKVDSFVWGVVNAADPADGSYPGRMLKAGLQPKEVVAQCKDLMFAGTDSSGMNLSTLCWHLAKNPEIHQTLRTEILQARKTNPTYDPSTLPYLRACIRESLRLSLANPTRLPRVVPSPAGWTFHSPSNQQTYYFPPGTVVSAQIHTLHSDPTVFDDPERFWPERWLEDDDDDDDKNSNNDKASASNRSKKRDMMNTSFIPFGLGQRQCIARNLAMTELTLAGRAIVEAGVLERARPVAAKVEIIEWFNSRVVGEEICLAW